MTVRSAVVGTGYWGKNLLRNLNGLGALYAFCDADSKALATFAAEYPDATPYQDYEAMIADPKIDAVVIATPAATHGVLAEKALNAGKHVFVEKPLCLDVDEARRLDALAGERELILMVGHLLLYHPAFVALKAAVGSGLLGDLRYIHSTRASLGKIRMEENALWSFAPHDISMILSLAGRLPKRVTCNGEAWLNKEVADLTLSHLDFGSGLQAHIFVSWLHPYKDHRLVVIGERGMIVFNDTVPGEEKLMHYPHSVGWDGNLPVLDKAEAVPLPYGTEEPLKSECAHFLDCVGTGVTPRSDAKEGTAVLSVLDWCQQALTAKQPVVLED
ncbi:Gfo/Idh/MocA family oxidoreductase [Rhodospirillaceae bacterium KN72]|uniref:Gfo/Idh/MocA family oxidoreductase n=1 Tax=Pacificispira spongiicola TaxID=2729598 RepID=A0A7Y0E1N2_9PROT|nr:Gfo/Idh/MocA family oxidoreductase [Pacificispira spongiicola]NMM45597.1 Gfo/Idh/MocA family oxidoreductase [Pacificispira spongiicola]